MNIIPTPVQCSFNTVYIIESRREGDGRNGFHLYEWMKLKSFQVGIDVQYATVDCKYGLIQILRKIENDIDKGHRPFIHFEMHGSPNGLQAGKQMMLWVDVLDELRYINIACGNNLFVAFAVCNGFFLFPEIDIEKAAPFSSFVGCINELNFGKSADDFQAFYEEFFESLNMNNALAALNKYATTESDKFKHQHAIDFFNYVWSEAKKIDENHELKQMRIAAMLEIEKEKPRNRNIPLTVIRTNIEEAFSPANRENYRQYMLQKFLMD